MLNILYILSYSVFTNNPRRSELASSYFQMSKLLKATRWCIDIRARYISSLLHASPRFSTTSSFLPKINKKQKTTLKWKSLGNDDHPLEMITFGHLSGVAHL